jgi:hypothetical protein
MKLKFGIVNAVLGGLVIVLAGLAVWQYMVSGRLHQNIKERRETLKREKATVKRLDKLRGSSDLDDLEKAMLESVPIGDIKALALAKDIKDKVRSLQLENFSFSLGDIINPDTSAAAPQPAGGVMEIIPLKVTITFEAQYPRIMEFLEHLYGLSRFVSIDRLTVERIEFGGENKADAGMAGGVFQEAQAPSAQYGRPFFFSDVARKAAERRITQKATIVLTTYTFTQ